ncbi:hypothetical protein [Undibacterium sp. TJN19]|uniref:hypothetical protein n=1 Tax=Undibacterium sp. TJN19 TaxID=3413055 RepID=UPI003BF289F5
MKVSYLVLLGLSVVSGFAIPVYAQVGNETATVAAKVEDASIRRFAPMENPFFAQPIELRGKMGGEQIRMHLQPKTEDRDSVEGSYVVLSGKRNQGKKILLAGEVSGNKLSMEESEDGVDVSGQWDGELKGNTIRGIWQSDDGKISMDFVIELLPPPKLKKTPASTKAK